MAEANECDLLYDVETDWGILDTTPTLLELRFTRESLEGEKKTEESEEINESRMLEDVIETGQRAFGGFEFELSYASYDDFILGILYDSAWSSAVEITSPNLDAAAADNSINDNGGSYLHTASLAITGSDTITRDAGSWIADGFRNGMVVTIANSEDPANDGAHTITALSALVMTIGAGGLTNNAADTAMDITNAGGFITDGFLAGQWLESRGWTGAGTTANGYMKIESVTAAKMVVSGPTLINDALGETITLSMLAQATNGVTEKSFSFERDWTELTNVFNVFRGMVPERMTLDIPTEGRITGSFDFVGKQESTNTVTYGDGSPTAANTNEIMASGVHVVAVYVGNTSVDVNSLSLEFVNGTREDKKITSEYPSAIGKGGFRVSGTLQAFFTDHTDKTAFLNHTETSISVVLEDTAGNGYIIDLPSIKYTACRTVAEEIDGLSLEEISFTTIRNTTEDLMARICKFAA